MNHKAARVRWEAMHAIALTAHLNADTILQLFNILTTLIHVKGSMQKAAKKLINAVNEK
ncbi:MAG: hypothetical protein WD469_13635 [Paenibacillaceae bacterium]